MRMGLPGFQGHMGFIGLQSSPEPIGDLGIVGSQGYMGEVGSGRMPGPVGVYGSAGDSGEMGVVGMNGEIGQKGAKGERGMTGDYGSIGPAGAPGPMYDPYAGFMTGPMMMQAMNCTDENGDDNCTTNESLTSSFSEHLVAAPMMGSKYALPQYREPPPGAHVIAASPVVSKQYFELPQQDAASAPVYNTEADMEEDDDENDILCFEDYMRNDTVPDDVSAEKSNSMNSSENLDVETKDASSSSDDEADGGLDGESSEGEAEQEDNIDESSKEEESEESLESIDGSDKTISDNEEISTQT